MSEQEKFNLLKANYLFQDLQDEQIGQILKITQDVLILKGDFLLRENEMGDDVFLITSGKAGVIKDGQQIAIINPGEVIGEMSLIDHSPRSASIVALEEAKFLKIPLSKLPAFPHIVQNISKQLTKRLRFTNESTVKALQAELEGAKMREEMGRFLFTILIGLSGWIFASTIAIKYTAIVKSNIFVSAPIIFLLFLLCISQIKYSAYPHSFYGLTLNNWKKNVWEGFIFSLPVFLAATVLKICLVNYSPLFQNKPVFTINFANPYWLVPAFIYMLFTPLQEFITRGVLQTCIKFSFSGSRTKLWSILLANLIFASFHIYISPIFSIAAFIVGFLWGWLYARQGSIVGCSVSHALIGMYCLFFLDFVSILKAHIG